MKLLNVVLFKKRDWFFIILVAIIMTFACLPKEKLEEDKKTTSSETKSY